MKFRNHILRLDDDHIVKRVYLGLKDEPLVGAGDTKNGARGHLERLARTANWMGKSFEKSAAKDAAKEYVESRQNALFKDDLIQKSTLRELKKVVDVDRVTLPEYLTRKCPISLCHGRMLKTQLRLGTHQLASSKDRMIPRGARGPTYMQCRCCSGGVEETVQHALFECECHRGIRDDFVARIRRKDPMFGIATDEQRTHLLLSDDTPEEFDNFLYRYLISLFASREMRLDSLAAGGRPQGQLPSSDGSLRDPGSG